MLEISIINGFTVEHNVDGTFAIYENPDVEKPLRIANSASEMIRYCNTHQVIYMKKLNKKELIKAINEGRRMSDDRKYKEVELEMLNRRR